MKIKEEVVGIKCLEHTTYDNGHDYTPQQIVKKWKMWSQKEDVLRCWSDHVNYFIRVKHARALNS